ncbi:MAG TPA: hypothetical protein PLV42_04960 [bacterium]|nr:hypothetical protein [bacterium]
MHDGVKQAERLVTDLLSLSKFPEKPLPENFESTLHRRIVEAAATRPAPAPRWGFLRPALIALSFVAVFAIGILIGRSAASPAPEDTGAPVAQKQDIKPQSLPQLVTTKTVVKRGEPVTIRLVYDSAKDIDKVRFSIVLDSGVRFRSGDPDIAAAPKLEWEGSLTAGRNEIPIVVASDDIGERVVRADARFNGTTVENVVTLIVKEDADA